MRSLFLALILASTSASAGSQTAPAASAPAATVEDLSWLAGHWVGEGLGGQSYETISPPVAGQMTGHFQQVGDGKLLFYEIYHIVPHGGSLLMRLKHFNADLTGWEEKQTTVDFPLIAVEKNLVRFDGLSMRLIDADTLETLVNINRGGKAQEMRFRFRRASK